VTQRPVSLVPDLATDWRDSAACSGYPNSLFFPGPDATEKTLERAIAICSTCPATAECLEYSLETNQRAGVWGGTSEEQRKSLRRKWLAGRRRSA
jgi:WhiB family transcriptional regulator, redox-sensing transcriptional regulator